MRRVISACGLAALAVAASAACHRGPPGCGGGDAPNLMLLTVDTLRADHVSSYG